MNDGACDPAGRFWAGSCAYAETEGAGTVYRVDADGTTTAVLRGTTISNGLGWSLDGNTLWFSDSGLGTVDAFDFEPRSGTLSRRRTIIGPGTGLGVPDGLTVDSEGHLWVAFWDGGEVRRYEPGGRLLARVRLPVSRPTSCCFGGAGLNTLFISTARFGLNADDADAQPDAGRLFSVEPGVSGVAQPFFGDPRRG
jgi:sugar lactone lactonase YvrE